MNQNYVSMVVVARFMNCLKGGIFLFAIQSVLINEIFWTTCQSRPLHAASTFHHFKACVRRTYECSVRFERTCQHCLLAVPLKKVSFLGFFTK